jgi:hypothetical protein
MLALLGRKIERHQISGSVEGHATRPMQQAVT